MHRVVEASERSRNYSDGADYSAWARVKVLGRGQHGAAVLLQHPKNTNKYVVCKEIQGANKNEANEVANEVRILSTLDHSNIVSYLGSFHNGEVLSIVMEYADGGTLDQKIEYQKSHEIPFRSCQVVAWTKQLGSAVAAQLVGQRLLVPTHVFGDAAAACDRQRKVGLSRALQPGVSRTRRTTRRLRASVQALAVPWLRARSLIMCAMAMPQPHHHKHIVFTTGAFQPRLRRRR